MATLADFDERRVEFLCDPHTYIEAATSVEHGAVRFEEFGLERARGLVEDDEIFESTVWTEGDRLRWSCTCDSWTDEKLCVHVAATAIAAWRDLPREAGGREDVLKGETQETDEPRQLD
jgi:hypothetical protein